MATTSYLIGLGSNRGHGRRTTPARMLTAAMAAMAAAGLSVRTTSGTVSTRPLAFRGRTYANAVALIDTPLAPPDLLAALKAIERRLGRRAGRRWGDRPIDLDILAWEGGGWRTLRLTIPHPGLATRPFALLPAAAIAPAWRHPRSGLALRHLAARLTRGRGLPRPARRGRGP